ncbi:MAG: hypothetical protein M1834_001456 [Cirrosporium novae-zelandiae]|nr:MAG: hypothetical protein M1834_001456 [Cirrosporium novae-zelandiae]
MAILSSTSTAAQTADPSEPPQNIPVLIRATTEAPKANTTFTPTPTQPFPPKSLKDKTKLSTIVQPEDLDTFFLKYAEICKGGMQQGLKKRDRKKRDKKKKKGKSKVEKV